MALQIANPSVVQKIHNLSKLTGLSKTAAVETAVDEMLKVVGGADSAKQRARILALLAQFDRSEKKPTVSREIEWDEFGLPE